MNTLWIIARGLIICSTLLTSVTGFSEERLFEAEEFQGLKRYPYHKEDEQGWYARESNCRYYGAPGKAYHAQIHATAKNTVAVQTLDKPLPPGKYAVFARVTGMQWIDKENIIKIKVGNAESAVAWTKFYSRFTWVRGTDITLTKPATRMELIAEQFGGKGFRHLYAPQARTLAVDSIYLTTDLAKKTGPVSVVDSMIAELGRDTAPEGASAASGKYRKLRMNETPDPLREPVAYSINLESYDGRRNVWPNSSFELGGGDGWSTHNYYNSVHIFSERDHIKGDAYQGEYFMRMPGNHTHYSRIYTLPKAGAYTLSAALRSKPGEKVKISLIETTNKRKWFSEFNTNALLTIEADTGPEWKRFSASADLKPGTLVLAVDGACDIDAVQLEPGKKITDYEPRAEIEASLATPFLGNIMYSDSPVTLDAWACNSSDKKQTARLSYRITDVAERVIAEKTIDIETEPGKTTVRKVSVEPVLNGLFSAVYSAQGRPPAEGELVYTVLPPIPEGTPRHALASNMDNVEAAHELMARMGHKWQLYCKIQETRPGSIHPKEDTWNWKKAEDVLTLPEKHGMKVMPCLWPTRASAPLVDESMMSSNAYAEKRDVTRMLDRAFPDLEKWEEYCRQVALHLGDTVKWWTVEDETEMYYSPEEFARITFASAEGFKKSGKDMKVSLSCTPDFTEEMIVALGGKVPLGGFGASSYDFEYWDACKTRYLQERYDLPWACIGVGVGHGASPIMQHTMPGYAGVYPRAVQSARQLVLLSLAQDARIIGHYTGRIWMRTGLYNNDCPLMSHDGTPLPHGFSYSCIPLFLANAKPVEDIYRENLDTIFFVYRQNGKLGACTWANNTPNLDIHYKTEPRTWHDFRLPGTAGKVKVLDMYGNPHQDLRTDGKDIVFELTEEPCFIINDGMSEDEFKNALASSSARPRDFDFNLAFVPGVDGGIDLGVTVRNNTGKAQNGLKLDANFPPDRMVTKTGWLFPDRNGKIDPVEANGKQTGRIKTRAGLDFPVENAAVSVWLTDSEGKEHTGYETLWMTVAPKLDAAGIDGKLTEWESVQPAWMYYTFSWARFGRHITQFVRNGEHFKYVHTMDARAAIYTGYDDKNLYIAMRCEDDYPIFSGDSLDFLEVKLSPTPGTLEHSKTLTVKPGDSGAVAMDGIPGVSGVMQTQDDTWIVEIAVPFSELGVSPDAGKAIGFDVVWHDADRDGDNIVTGVWRWAGRSKTLGSLFFGE